jgi:hypothetical protein
MPSTPIRPAGSFRRRAVVLGAAALTIVAVGAGTTAAFAATSPSPSASSSASTASQYPHLRALERQLVPAALKADLATLHKDPKSQKAAERAAIEKKAKAGDYGTALKGAHLFARRGHRHLAALLPAALKADLKTLRHDAKHSAARTSEFDSIWSKALSGGYGSSVETAAKAAVAARTAHQQS